MAEPPPDSSADERALGWGDEDDDAEVAAANDRLLAERPPHYDQP